MAGLIALGIVLALWLFIAAAGAAPLILLYFASYKYVDIPNATVAQAIEATGHRRLAAMGFEPEGAIGPIGIRMALFRHRDNHTAIAVYFAAGTAITDIVTYFPNHVGLTTSSTGDGIVAPLAPGSTIQCLPSFPLDELWKKHQEGVQRLREQLNVREHPMGDLSKEVEAAQRRQIRYIFTRPWLILTFPYRFFILKSRYKDLTLATQFERGWIDSRTLSEIAHG